MKGLFTEVQAGPGHPQADEMLRIRNSGKLFPASGSEGQGEGRGCCLRLGRARVEEIGIAGQRPWSQTGGQRSLLPTSLFLSSIPASASHWSTHLKQVRQAIDVSLPVQSRPGKG